MKMVVKLKKYIKKYYCMLKKWVLNLMLKQ